MITKYKYTKLRKMVKTSQVAKGVKDLMFCALKSYKDGHSTPATNMFRSDGMSCLVGAALIEKDVEIVGWTNTAMDTFKISFKQADNIIEGFDGFFWNKNNKTQRLAYNIAKELGLHED